MDDRNKTLSIIGLVLGVVGIIATFNTLVAGTVLGIVGIIVSQKARRTEPEGYNLATIGWICSIVALAISAVRLILLIIAFLLLGSGLTYLLSWGTI